MSRKIKVLVVLTAVLLLTVGATATVMAQEETKPAPQANGLLARVAGILDIPQESLVDAFNQARQEMRQEVCEGDCEQTRQQMRQTRQELRQQWQEMRQEANGECDQTRQQLRQAHQELRQQWGELRQGQQ